MRVPVTGTKMVVHSTPPPQCERPQHKPTFGQKINGTQCKPAFDQKFSSPQQKSSFSQHKFAEPPPASAFDEKFSNKQQTLLMKSDQNDSQQKDVNNKSDSPAAMVLNIPVNNNDEPKELGTTNGECKQLEDLMSNLSVSGKGSKIHDRDSVEDTKKPMKENDFSRKTEALNDSFKKLTISAGKNKKPVHRGEKENDEKGKLIERGPVPSSQRLQQRHVHPYTNKSVLTLPARYSLHGGGVVAEQPCINRYESHMPTIPQPVADISNGAAVNVAREAEEIALEILKNEKKFLSIFRDWVDKEIKQCDDSTMYSSTTDIQPPVFTEPILGNTSPHCSRDSTYGTLSPDSNVVSPMSYVSPMSSPVDSGNDFTHETVLNEVVTSSSSSSDSNYLPDEPAASSDLLVWLDGYLNISKNANGLQQNNKCDDYAGLDKPSVVGNQMQQFYPGVSQTNSVAQQVLQVTNDKLSQEISLNNSAAPHVVQVVSHKLPSEMPCSNSVSPHTELVNSKLSTEVCHTNPTVPRVNSKLPVVNIDPPLNVAYSVTANQFNFTVQNMLTTTAPPKYVLANVSPTNHVQPNVMTHQTVYVSAKPNDQIPLNISVANTAPQFTSRRNVIPVMEAKLHKPDNSVNSFICGDNAKKNASKSVPINHTARVSAPICSVRPIERQILPAGTEVYESGMSVPAAVRLKSLMDNIGFTVQYVKVCLDLANRPDLLKERLFQLLTETPKAQNWLMRIYAHIALTVSMQSIPSRATVLRARNSEGFSLLYLACVNHPDQPMIARYIADSLLDVQESPDEIYDAHGNSLVHLLASLGDSHGEVLAELLNVRHRVTQQPVFNVNRPNDTQMETPLHVAVSKHSVPYVNCLATVKVLITHGANVTAQDIKGMTPLHYAVQGNCELKILTLLLQSPTSRAALDITDSEHNSALHLAAANNSISLVKQKAVISSLIGHGASYRVQNMDGKVPLVLVDIERRQEIKKLFPKK